jgi:hypothetical protein
MASLKRISEMPSDLHEVYFTFGVIAEKAQVMETEAGNVALAYITAFVDTNNVTPEMTEWYKQLLDDINSKTFGTLFRAIKRSIQINDSILAIVAEALDKRNYVTHRFFRHHNFAIHSEEGRREMIDDLIEAGKKFDLAHAVLEGMSSGLLQIAGRSAADFGMEEAKKLVARGKCVKI